MYPYHLQLRIDIWRPDAFEQLRLNLRQCHVKKVLVNGDLAKIDIEDPMSELDALPKDLM
jgi:hypothetical protein